MKLSEIVASLTSLKETVASLISDKTKATAEALTNFSAKLSTLETGVVAELNSTQAALTAEQGKVADLAGILTAEQGKVTDLTGKLTAEQSKVTDLTGKLTAAETAGAAKQTAIDAANGKLVAFLSSLNQKPADNATLEQNADACTKAITGALASQGLKIEQLPKADAAAGGGPAQGSILEQYQAAQAKGPKPGAEFYAKNQKAIDAAFYAQLKTGN